MGWDGMDPSQTTTTTRAPLAVLITLLCQLHGKSLEMHASTLCAQALVQPPNIRTKFFHLISSIKCFLLFIGQLGADFRKQQQWSITDAMCDI